MQLNKLKEFMRNLFSQIIYFLFPLRVISFFSYLFRSLEKRKREESKMSFVNINIFGSKFVLYLEKGGLQTPAYVETSQGIRTYEETMIFCLSEILRKKNVVFFDIGSYISYYGLFASSFTNDESIVYAIESNPLYDKITEKSKEHNQFKNFNHLNSILSDKCEEYLVHDTAVVRKDHILKYKDNPIIKDQYEKQKIINILKKGKSYHSTTLDELCSMHKVMPNILKIDVHGAEGLVLNGAKNILENSVEYILLEVHQQQLLDLFSNGIKKNEILDQLNQRGFNNYLISPFRYNLKNSDYKEYKISEKLKYLKLTKNNSEEILFDRNQLDIFILSIKSSLNIDDLNCF